MNPFGLSTMFRNCSSRLYSSYNYLRFQKRFLSSSNIDGVRIGCASGFWGDTMVAAPQLIYKGNIDFLVFDYLSEITMSLLTAAKTKFPNMGYAPDFIEASLAPYLKDIHKKGIRIVSNAGGVNPEACVAALKAAAGKADINLDIAVVSGDDLVDRRSEFINSMKDMDTGNPLPASTTSINAYLGAYPIARALDMGASVVITGRCVDSAVTLGPLIHQYKWKPHQYDLLASGSLAGHLIECGAQATGGIFTDYDRVPDWYNIGFPIVDCRSNGDFIVTKPKDTGGIVSRATVCEQLVYELGDPSAYLLPDVTCDFSDVEVKQIADNEVAVSGARGRAPTDSYKVSATYLDGYRITAVAMVMGGDAVNKGRRTGEDILKRVRGMLKLLKLGDFKRTHLQIIGGEESYAEPYRRSTKSREAVVWLAAEHKEKKALEILAREIAPAGTGMAPGLTGIAGGRPKVSPIMRLHSFLLKKDTLKTTISMNGLSETVDSPPNSNTDTASSSSTSSRDNNLPAGECSYRLEDLVWARSGDKGDTCNIGVVARSAEIWPYLKERLTCELVANYFSTCLPPDAVKNGCVFRYEMEGIRALNFVLKNALGGGGIASLRPDPQGKAFAQMLLDLELTHLPADLAPKKD